MQNWQVALVVLVSVLVGAALPVLVQLWLTLKTARGVLAATGQRIDQALDEVTATTAQVGELTHTVQGVAEKIRVTAAIGAAVGPAIVAAIRAFRAPAEPTADGADKAQAVSATTEDLGDELEVERH